VLDLPAYRRIFTDAFDHGRVRMSVDDFVAIMPRLDRVVDELLVGWMAPFVEVLCETPDPQLLEAQEEFNPVVQQKILATDTRFSVKEVSMLQDAFNNYRVSGGGDAVDMDALASDFPLEMTDERFQRVFASFGPRANGLDIDIFSFVHALAIACRGSPQEKAGFAFKLFATAGKDGSLMTRDDLYGMMRLDLSQNAALERLVTAFMERYKKKHPSAKSLTLKATDSALSESGAQTPSVSGSQLGRFVDALMQEYGHDRPVSSLENAESVRSLTCDEFLAWTTREKYEMASLRIMREVVFVDLGLVPSSKEEELAIVQGCYKSFDPASLVEDEAWFLIEKKWFDHWCKYIGFKGADTLATASSSTSLSDLSSKVASSSSSKSSAPSASTKADAALLDADGNYVRPKPINNYPILTNDRREHILKSADEIKLGRHYAIVPEQLWMGLKVWYGGGPEIRRKVVIKADGTAILDIWEDELLKKKKLGSDDGDDESPDLTSETEKNKRTKALALPRRMRTGGSVGLTNLGNTCYMNSALQCLTNTQLLAEYFLSGMYLDDINRTSTLGLQGKLAEVYGKLAEDMWCAKQKALSPRNFKKTIGKFNEAFRGSDQQDAQELLAFLLSGLSEDLNRIHDKPYVEQPDSDGRFDGDLADEWWRNHLRREVSIIVALFTGQYKSLLTCSECGFKSARFEPFTFLQLPLPEPTHNTVTLALVLSNGLAPMKVSVRLGISATIFDLKHELMKLCHTDFDLPHITEADIKICEYTGSIIMSFKADSRRIGQIRSIERLIAFQLEPLDTETIQATRNRRPSYVPATSAAQRIEEIESEREAQAKFFDTLAEGTLVEVKSRSQSHEYIPAVIVECPSVAADIAVPDNETEQQPLYRVRLQRVDEELKVPVSRLRPRQARLLNIPLLSRKLSYSALYFKNPFRPAPFGIPHLVRICPELTSGFDLYKLVWQRVRRYVEASPPHKWEPQEAPEDVTVSNRIDTIFTGLTSSCGFVLRRVESKGLTDSRAGWLTRSFGHIIPCTDEPLSILEDETIAIDWDLEIFQDRDNLEKMKHIESHASVEKNEAIDKGPVPLRHCLDAFTSEEKISEGYCSSCRSHQEMTKKLEIWRLPPVMVVHLKRFQYTQTYRRKLASLVEFPVHGLDLNSCVAPHIDQPERYAVKRKEGEPVEKKKKEEEFPVNVVVEEASAVSSSDGEKTDDGKEVKEPKGDTVTFDLTDTVKTRASSKSNGSAAGGPGPTITRVRRGYTNTNLDQSRCLETKYDLYGVVNHQGALGGGHYTAYAKNFLDDQWYYYDDERVRVVEESKVVSPSAYLLFYVRSDMKGTLVKDLYPPNSNKKITDEDINRFVEDDRRCNIM
jgi:ubiquitin C-terminal hydrolase